MTTLTWIHCHGTTGLPESQSVLPCSFEVVYLFLLAGAGVTTAISSPSAVQM